MTKCYMGCHISNRYLHSKKTTILGFSPTSCSFLRPSAHPSSRLDMKIKISSNIVFLQYLLQDNIALQYYINTIPIRYVTRLIPITFLDIAQITHGEQGHHSGVSPPSLWARAQLNENPGAT